ITIYALRKKPDGAADKASVIALDSAEGNASISILHESGASISIGKEGNVVVMNKAGDAFVDVNDDGVTINGAAIAITGAANLGDADPGATQFVALANLVEAQWTAFTAAVAAVTIVPN